MVKVRLFWHKSDQSTCSLLINIPVWLHEKCKCWTFKTRSLLSFRCLTTISDARKTLLLDNFTIETGQKKNKKEINRTCFHNLNIVVPWSKRLAPDLWWSNLMTTRCYWIQLHSELITTYCSVLAPYSWGRKWFCHHFDEIETKL